jgi:ATPase subunit of ABC transporter with duplicated ATPase domains
VADPDLLLLDQPTNHLDVEGIAWLADHLVTRRTRADAALVVVTHDRWFLDAVATLTWEVGDGGVQAYEGGYAAYVLARAERDRLAAAQEERRTNLLRKELAWLRRGPPARTSKPQFRIDAANALIEDEPSPRDDVALVRFATRRLGKVVVDLVDATVDLVDRRILDDVTWRLAPGERVGVVGVNGAGKSTLLRAVSGDQPLTSGRRRAGKTVVIAFLTQEVRELERYASYRVIEAVEDVRSVTTLGGKEVTAGQLATRLGFTGARQRTRVGDLSGGERRRLQLLRLLMTEPNVLILDEPTNDLDIDTLTSLEDVLDGWAGTLIVVSHDRYLLERVADHQVALLGDGRLRDLPGGVDEYLRLRAAILSAPSPPVRALDRTEFRLEAPRTDAETAPASAAEIRAARKEMSRIERRLDRITEEESRLHDEMARSAADHQVVLRLDADLRALQREREDLEADWLNAAETAG